MIAAKRAQPFFRGSMYSTSFLPLHSNLGDICLCHGNPKALEHPTAVNNRKQSIIRIICVYHRLSSSSCLMYINVVPRQMDRLNSFARVIFGRKQCVSRRIWQTIGPTGDLCCCPLNGFLRHHLFVYSYSGYTQNKGVTDLICMR